MFEKPGPKKKAQKRDRIELDLARGQSCVKCSQNDGSTVSAHLEGQRKSHFGKCLGGKPDDEETAWLCGCCHPFMDSNPEHYPKLETIRWIRTATDEELARFIDEINKTYHSEEFLFLVAVTKKLKRQLVAK